MSYPYTNLNGSETPWQPHLGRRTIALGAIAVGLLLVLFSMSSGSTMTNEDILPPYSERLGKLIKQFTWSLPEEPANMTEYICPECNCSVPGSYYLSPRFVAPIPSIADARRSSATKRTIKRHLLSEISLYLWINPVYLPPTALAPLYSTYFGCPDRLIRLNFDGLQHDKPTTYMYTRTGDGGRLKANERRLRYFQRHIDTLYAYNDLVAAEGFPDGAKAEERQLIWIVIEDGDHLNEDLNHLLNSTGLRE